uniref:Chlorophyll a-b binding protein, chloroplastic n=1 Tax=Chlamydomonas leiostraca TaxID=1034604 RepID=A0A7S0RTR5_9CHLO|mmetsp:Transcript_31150/g.79437  ORF Transcript_31150/g.79437 Transcript_31150/m.79437 type:complete len:419 (+) Transcript_31150:1262-2518(+)
MRFLSLKRLKKRSDGSKLVISKGNAGTFEIDTRTLSQGLSWGGFGGGGGSRAASSSERGASPAFSSSSRSSGVTSATSASSSQASTSSSASSSGNGTGAWGAASAALGFTQAPQGTSQWGVKTRIGPAASASPSSSSSRGGAPAAATVGSGAATGMVVRKSARARTSSVMQARSMLGMPALAASNGYARPMEELFFADKYSLSYLDGSLPGDMGFDPLGLFHPDSDAGLMNQRWLRYSEVIHGRWAMLGVVGCLAPEYLAYQNIIPKEHGVVWFKTGFLPTAGQDYDFGMDPVSLAWVMMVLMAFAETRRLQDYRAPGSLMTYPLPFGLERSLSSPQGGDPVYPGGPLFNFLDVVETESAMRRFKEKEIKHGRLAMVAMVGLFAQAAATSDSPFINLLDHMFDPLGYNAFTNLPYINK